jgi:hypothetical protein
MSVASPAAMAKVPSASSSDAGAADAAAKYEMVELPPLSADCLHVPTEHPLLEGIPADAPLEERRQTVLARAKGLCDQPPNEHWGKLHDVLVKARWEQYVAELLAGAAAEVKAPVVNK